MSLPNSAHSWYFLDSGPKPYALNMATDEALLEAMPRLGKPVLRFYGWTERALSFGYFQRYREVEALTFLRPMVRRPTGGGMVPHDADWTYSLAAPTTAEWYSLTAIESYRRIHEWLQAAFSLLKVPTEVAPEARKSHPGQCFAGWEQFDLLWQGRKIAGAAQRRRRDGLLIQGSVQPPPLPLSREAWQLAMREAGEKTFGLHWTAFAPDAALLERARTLAELKYSLPAYNERR
jgi:lipoate-protein ligase A